MLTCLRPSCNLPLRRFICYNHHSPSPDLQLYKESFAKRMAMAGIKPHHRIALGVSGGPDSTALCVLAAAWKSDGLMTNEGLGCINGLLGIVVDHKLRPESGEEADLVRNRVLKMGIRCVVECCDWSKGKPKLGHLQEAARDMRYQIFQRVCIEQQVGVLLIGHHADDQAELFILRLSRNSGVLGLAGMAFISQLFPTHSYYCSEGNQGIFLVRPMLEFSKDDMYKICKEGYQEWVEDPTNQRPLFARNRLRMSLKNISSNAFKSDLQSLISACRLTRSFIENACRKMIEHCVTLTDHGYAIIDLEKLEPSNVEDLCLSKFIATILQFISQRQRPIRGSVSRLLLDYVRRLPCKTSLTAAGCYLSPAPRSSGTKILVTYDSPQSSTVSSSYIQQPYNKRPLLSGEIDQISHLQSCFDQYITEYRDVHFLHAKSSMDVLNEAKRLNLISESTLLGIQLLQMEEHKKFISKPEGESNCKSPHEKGVSSSSQITLCQGESCHFMGRFFITYEVCRRVLQDGLHLNSNSLYQESANNHDHLCQFCMTSQFNSITIRHMVDADWLYLTKISSEHSMQYFQDHTNAPVMNFEQILTREDQCTAHMRVSAKKALRVLKSIPVSARRALPVVVNSRDLLLNIPSIGLSCCPYLHVTAVFKPRVPLGGGHSSYL